MLKIFVTNKFSLSFGAAKVCGRPKTLNASKMGECQEGTHSHKHSFRPPQFRKGELSFSSYFFAAASSASSSSSSWRRETRQDILIMYIHVANKLLLYHSRSLDRLLLPSPLRLYFPFRPSYSDAGLFGLGKYGDTVQRRYRRRRP